MGDCAASPKGLGFTDKGMARLPQLEAPSCTQGPSRKAWPFLVLRIQDSAVVAKSQCSCPDVI